MVPFTLMSAVGNFQTAWANGAIAKVREYPPVPSGSSYQRTLVLYNGWYVEGPKWSGGAYSVFIRNRAPYAKFVQGKEQAWFHRDSGWKRLNEYLDRGGYRAGVQGVISGHIRSLR